MTESQTDWQPRSAKDFANTWRCFVDSDGRCKGEIPQGTVEILEPVVGSERKAVVRFVDLNGFPRERSIDAELKEHRLELEVRGARFRIVPCGFRNGNRVIQGVPDKGTKPGTWTAEEEDTDQPESTGYAPAEA